MRCITVFTRRTDLGEPHPILITCLARTDGNNIGPICLLWAKSSLKFWTNDTRPTASHGTQDTTSQKYDASYQYFRGWRQVSRRLIRLHCVNVAVASRCASW